MVNNTLNKSKKNLFVLLFIFSVVLVFLYAYRDFLSLGMMQYGDVIPFPVQAKDTLNFYFSSWAPQDLGTEVSAEPFYFIIAILTLIFHNAVIAQKVYYFIALPLAAITMYFLLSRFVKSEPAKWIGSFIYAVNPQVLGAPTGPLLIPYALLPLFLLFLFRIFEEKNRLRNVFLLTLFLGIGMSYHGLCTFLVSFPPLVLFAFLKILQRRERVVFSSQIILFLLFAYFFSFGLLILPNLVGSILGYFTPQGMFSSLSVKSLINDVNCCYDKCTLLNLIRLAGNNGAPMWILRYNEHPPWTVTGYILPMLAFIPLLLIKDRKRLEYILGFSLLYLGTVLFCWLTKQGLTLGLFRQFPILFTFRNPGKLMMLLPLSCAPLMALGIEEIEKRLPMWNMRVFFLAIIISALAIYNWPFFTGNMGSTKSLEVYHTAYTVPSIYYKIGEWLDKKREEGFFRTLWLPADYDAQLSLRWIDPYTFSAPLGSEVYRAPNLEYVKFNLEVLRQEKTNNLGSLLALANVKYFIINLTSHYKDEPRLLGHYPVGDPREFVRILNKQKDIKLIVKNKKFLIYENQKFIPHIGIYHQIFFIKGKQSSLSKLSNFLQRPGLNINRQMLVFEERQDREEAKWLEEHSGARELKSASYHYKVIKVKKTEYQIDIETERPLYIFLGEAYSPSWEAYANNKRLKHFRALYWANGFYLDQIGKSEIRIVFGRQKIRNITLGVWAGSWIFLITAIVYTSRKTLHRKGRTEIFDESL